MKYYLDGFRPGNPDIKPALNERREFSAEYQTLPSTVDVLIVGTGPAGLCLAAQLAQYPEIKTLIIETSPRNIQKGKADGINTRTMEMFQAFGFAEKVKRESYWVNQTNFWMPDPENTNHIKRMGRVQDVADDSSEMPHILINQARLHQFFLEVMKHSPSRLEPDYNWSIKSLSVYEGQSEFPVSITVEDTGVNWGQLKQIQAKYVVGCDGARSQVRTLIGGQLTGEAAHQSWGVMDILANTDFPDIRQKCVIASATSENVLILPREVGVLFRMYVELDKLDKETRISSLNLGIDDIIARAKRILAPYTLDIKQVVWWSIYEIGHRITDRFDDVPTEGSSNKTPRVFTAGDACHTHSPKAGQGMNVSMQDSFNLGWKLAHVLQGRADQNLLSTYSEERRAEAQRLIDMDHKWARTMSAPPGESELDSTEEPRIVRQFKENLEFTSGLSVLYTRSHLTAAPTYQALATGQIIGRRFHSAPVVRLSDAKQMQLGHCADADGRWRIYIFGKEGDDGRPGNELSELAQWLQEDSNSPIQCFSRPDENVDALFDIRVIFPTTFYRLDYGAMPGFFKPKIGKLGLQDHEKIFCIDHKGVGDIYRMRGIDRNNGCMIVVRPDQYIGYILPLQARQEITDYFSALYKQG